MSNLLKNIEVLLNLAADKKGLNILNLHHVSCASTLVPEGFDGVLTRVSDGYVDITFPSNVELGTAISMVDGEYIIFNSICNDTLTLKLV